MPTPLPTLQEMARLLGGEVVNGGVLAPGPGHTEDDRSLSVKPSRDAECGFVLNSFAGDDIRSARITSDRSSSCRRSSRGSRRRRRTATGGGKPYSPTIAKYTYRNAGWLAALAGP